MAYRLNNQTIILLFVVGEMRVIRSLLAFVAVRGVKHSAAKFNASLFAAANGMHAAASGASRCGQHAMPIADAILLSAAILAAGSLTAVAVASWGS